jgi:hypothetical protein
MPHAATSISVQNVLSGLARLGMEPADGVHLVVLRLPMQREESRRIAKLYEFTGKVGLGSNILRAEISILLPTGARRDRRKSFNAKGAKEAKFRHGLVQGRRVRRPSSRVEEAAMGWKAYCAGI